ncbi:hypothetical protein QU38_00490, partial [Staphylococcus aureus]
RIGDAQIARDAAFGGVGVVALGDLAIEIDKAGIGEDARRGGQFGRGGALAGRELRRERLPIADLRAGRAVERGRHFLAGRGGKAPAPGSEPSDAAPFERDRAAPLGAGAEHLLGQQIVDIAGRRAAACLDEQ